MQALALLLLAFTALSTASNLQIDKARLEEAINENRVSKRNPLLEGILLDLIEQIRNLMLNGSESFPILDPLRIGSVEVDESLIGIPGAFIKLGDTTVDNLSTFNFETLSFSIEGIIFQRYIITFDTHIPEINVNTNSYDMSLKILGGDIYGTGFMNLKVVRPRIKGVISTSLTINNGVFLNINDCEIAVSLGDFQPVITGIWNSEVASNFVSTFLGNLIPELMTFFEFEINEILSSAVKIVGNEILGDINLVDLIIPQPETHTIFNNREIL